MQNKLMNAAVAEEVTVPTPKHFRLRSYEPRNGRITIAQTRAHEELWPQFGLTLENGRIDYPQVFGRVAPCFLEIGFGTGQSFLEVAKLNPDLDFIGVETHKPGVGALLLGVQLNPLTNLRVYQTDVIDVLEQAIPDASLDGVQIFFPDPWPKRRQQPRRLIQPAFVKLISSKIKVGGTLHLATDWEDYAKQMMRVLSAEESLRNLAGEQQFAERSYYRPIVTKFERRAIREKREIAELQFIKL